MSSDENEDPTGQFDAFRARQAEERAQQETQGAYGFAQETRVQPPGAYAFPQEYAAQPEEPVFHPARPTARPVDRMRSVLVLAGAVLAVIVLGLGAWLAFGSSSAPAASAAPGATSSPSPTGTATAKKAAYHVTIVSLGADSFTGTLEATGQTVTVTLTARTRYGTKAHPFSKTDLATGLMVSVRGRRTGTGAITATEVTQTVRSTA
ncbi:MAG TPA: DUF5666 domain-containing protein [Actinospica sp.]|nr:DUF5666 domain-containing protein [Actinospica sp.]